MRKERLLSPGPTPVPPEVLLELARPVIHHRTARNRAIVREATDGLKRVFLAKNDPLILASSGTGAMEAAVTNTVAAGEKAICIMGGKFGQRWSEICSAFGVEPVTIDVVWGEAVDPGAVAAALERHPDAAAVCATLCETSTAVVHDIRALGEITRPTPALLIVDAISGLGAVELRMDDWGADVVVGGSQKALMMPPGLGLVALSDKAWARVETIRRTCYYFDLLKARTSLEKDDTPWTPAHGLILGLRRALALIDAAGGVEAMWKAAADLAAATRKAVESMGLSLLSEAPANAVTAAVMPDGVDGDQIRKRMSERDGITVAGGQEALKGKIVRIAHLGFIDRFDVIAALLALADALREEGYPVETGGIALAFADVET